MLGIKGDNNLYEMDVYIDKKLTEDEDIAFNAGSHSELLKMHYQDFNKLVHPKVISA
jgi:Ala-tRNA(Pro) deacylase